MTNLRRLCFHWFWRSKAKPARNRVGTHDIALFYKHHVHTRRFIVNASRRSAFAIFNDQWQVLFDFNSIHSPILAQSWLQRIEIIGHLRLNLIKEDHKRAEIKAEFQTHFWFQNAFISAQNKHEKDEKAYLIIDFRGSISKSM